MLVGILGVEDTWLPINYSLAIDYQVKSGIWDCCYESVIRGILERISILVIFI